jgi:hypothetical protein
MEPWTSGVTEDTGERTSEKIGWSVTQTQTLVSQSNHRLAVEHVSNLPVK